MLLPRMLCSLASCDIVWVGNETVMTSPPVKNGLTSCRSGDIISIRHGLGGDRRDGDQVVLLQVIDRLPRPGRGSSRGWWPGSTCIVFTFSTACRQSSPKPMSRGGLFISASHQANSCSAIAISSSGV